MNKNELFEKYKINESHNKWDAQIDNWMSIEIYRIMHDGKLPPGDNLSLNWITEFLDKKKDMDWWIKNVMTREDFGSLYITSKRMIYRYCDKILEQQNKIKL